LSTFQWYYRSYPVNTSRERIEQEAAIEIDKVINENFEDMIYKKTEGYSFSSGMSFRTSLFNIRSDSIWVYFCVVTSTYMYGSKTFMAASDPAVITILKHPLSAWQTVDRRRFAYSDYRYIGFNDVAYGNGYFVAVGSNDKIAYSSDGETWNVVRVGTEYDINAVACGNGLFAAVGDYGIIMYSRDGETWDTIVPRESNDRSVYWYQIKSITYGGSYFIALGENLIAFFEDGMIWNIIEGGEISHLTRIRIRYNAIAYGGGFFSIVGADGMIKVCQWPITKAKTPVITRHPVNATYDLGSPANNLFAAIDDNKIGYSVLYYQWYRNDTDSNAKERRLKEWIDGFILPIPQRRALHIIT